MRKTSYSDLGLGDDELMADQDNAEDEGGTTADDSHSDYETDLRKKGGGSTGDFDDDGDDKRVSDVELLVPMTQTSASIPSSTAQQLQESRDQEKELLILKPKGSSGGVGHYESISSTDPEDGSNKKKNKSTTLLRRAFFSEFSPRPETVEEEDQDDENGDDNDRNLRSGESKDKRRKKSRESSLETTRGGDPNDSETGSPSKMTLLGLRKGSSKGLHGGIKAVLFGSSSTGFTRNRTKSLDVTELPLSSKPNKTRRISSCAQQNLPITADLLKEECPEGSSSGQLFQSQLEDASQVKEQSSLPLTSSFHPQRESSLPSSSSQDSNSKSKSSVAEESSSPPKHHSLLEKYPRRRSSGGSSSKTSSRDIPAKLKAVPPPSVPSSSSTVVHIESDV